jgi:hypothetical protein
VSDARWSVRAPPDQDADIAMVARKNAAAAARARYQPQASLRRIGSAPERARSGIRSVASLRSAPAPRTDGCRLGAIVGAFRAGAIVAGATAAGAAAAGALATGAIAREAIDADAIRLGAVDDGPVVSSLLSSLSVWGGGVCCARTGIGTAPATGVPYGPGLVDARRERLPSISMTGSAG